jgi:hypothetical protein
MVPVPLKESTFRPIEQKWARYNVEVDLGKIAAFSNDSIYRGKLLFADLQTNADFNGRGRLGSGRSGYYAGAYLKGVGRTQLAANWNVPDDLYHGSGMLTATSAAREFLLTRFLRAAKCENLIVPCEGVLVRNLPKAMQNHPKKVFARFLQSPAHRRARLPRSDFHLHALSVKPANFCRASNFGWWFSNLQGSSTKFGKGPFGEFFTLLLEGLQLPDGKPRSRAGEIDDIADLMIEGFERTVKCQLDAWKLGVHWGSFHNNFTLDGRYLDLETPTIFPSPLLGVLQNSWTRPTPPTIVVNDFTLGIGTAPLYQVWSARMFLRFFLSRLTFSIESGIWRGPEEEFLKQFRAALQNRLRRSWILSDTDRLLLDLGAEISKTFDLGSRGQKEVRRLLESAGSSLRESSSRARAPRPLAMTFHRLPFPEIARSEPVSKLAVYVPKFLLESLPPPRSENIEFNLRLNRVDEITDPDEWLEFLRDGTRKK